MTRMISLFLSLIFREMKSALDKKLDAEVTHMTKAVKKNQRK